jgi:very-short-patch-repair endonuclease
VQPPSQLVAQGGPVLRDVATVIGPQGWATWDQLLGVVSRDTVRRWVATGRLVRVHPEVYATPTAARDWRTGVATVVRLRRGVASHATALFLWDLAPHVPGPVHVSVEALRSGRGSPGVVLHRNAGLDWHVRRVAGVPVTSVERSVVDAWSAPAPLRRADVRGAAIAAVRRRMCRPSDLAAELALRTRLPGRAALAELVRLLEDGCRSELEIWGCLRVLRGPGMPTFLQQRPVVVGGKRLVLDAANEEVLLAVEMDGAAWHGSQRQREDDIRRDALLATVGWQTLRFSYRRLTSAPDACRREITAAFAARRRLLAVDRGR